MRRTLSTTARVNVFKAAGGICHLCEQRIQVGERWEVEHRIPIAMGGSDTPDNMLPAHVHCHRAKTTQDVADIARAKRREARQLGIIRSSRPMPGSKASGLKKHMDGRVTKR